MGLAPSAQDVIAALDRSDVLDALDEIDGNGVPARRRSKKFCLVHKRRHYPPKVVISFSSAFRYADDPEMQDGLGADDFYGGPQSNDALRRLGFTIMDCRCGGLQESAGAHPRAKRLGEPRVARVVVNGPAAMTQKAALRCLTDAFDTMREASDHADIVTTPGGFIKERLDLPQQPRGWDTPMSALAILSRAVDRCLEPFLRSLGKLTPPASYLTLGIDCVLPSHEPKYARNAQLVATIDLKSMKIIGWTGKSYPTADEEKGLLQVTDLASHFQTIGKWKCMVLGCHDLNMFSPRSIANRDPNGHRGRRAENLMHGARAYRPDTVLQHPHWTDTPNIWMGGWAGVSRLLKPQTYASGISYFRPHGKPRRARLEQILERTRFGNVVDYIWYGPGRVKVGG